MLSLRSAEPEGRAGRREAGSALVVVGEGTFDGRPEGGGVTGLADVGEFVDDDVVEQGHGQLHGGPVDVEPVVLTEGAPPVAEVSDVQLAGAQAARTRDSMSIFSGIGVSPQWSRGLNAAET